jgi:hypothetical protein
LGKIFIQVLYQFLYWIVLSFCGWVIKVF